MDQQKLRKWGLIGGAAALIAALGIATYRDQPPSPPPPANVAATTPSATAPIPALDPTKAGTTPAAESAGASPKAAKPAPKTTKANATVSIESAENPNLEFIVRVGPNHPLFAAQSLYESGQRAEAALMARSVMQQRKEFNGLCFENFTLGAELVLSHCAFVQTPLLKKTGARWTKKLRAMPGTLYAEENVILHPESRARP